MTERIPLCEIVISCNRAMDNFEDSTAGGKLWAACRAFFWGILALLAEIFGFVHAVLERAKAKADDASKTSVGKSAGFVEVAVGDDSGGKVLLAGKVLGDPVRDRGHDFGSAMGFVKN